MTVSRFKLLLAICAGSFGMTGMAGAAETSTGCFQRAEEPMLICDGNACIRVGARALCEQFQAPVSHDKPVARRISAPAKIDRQLDRVIASLR